MKYSRSYIVIVLAFLLLSLPQSAFGQETDEFTLLLGAIDSYLSSDPVTSLSVEDVYNNIVAVGNEEYTIVDNRAPDDFAKGHVPGAINVPRMRYGSDAALDALNKDDKYVFYCYTGTGSPYLAGWLGVLGYDVVNMQFGLTGWTDNWDAIAMERPIVGLDYPLVTGPFEVAADNELPTIETGLTDPYEIAKVRGQEYFAERTDLAVGAQFVFDTVVMYGDWNYFLLDIRPEEDYLAGHVEGAINIPFNELARVENLQKLPTDVRVVVICEDGQTSGQASLFLNMLGYTAEIMLYGMTTWTNGHPSMDFPIEGTAAR